MSLERPTPLLGEWLWVRGLGVPRSGHRKLESAAETQTDMRGWDWGVRGPKVFTGDQALGS